MLVREYADKALNIYENPNTLIEQSDSLNYFNSTFIIGSLGNHLWICPWLDCIKGWRTAIRRRM